MGLGLLGVGLVGERVLGLGLLGERVLGLGLVGQHGGGGGLVGERLVGRASRGASVSYEDNAEGEGGIGGDVMTPEEIFEAELALGISEASDPAVPETSDPFLPETSDPFLPER